MVIWTIKEGEPLPLDECKGRIMRCGIISEMLAERGHEVVWWSSDFLHQTKERLSVTGKIQIKDKYSLMLMHSPITYKRNVSFNRFLYSKALAKVQSREMRKAHKPDIIYCSFPFISSTNLVSSSADEYEITILPDLSFGCNLTFVPKNSLKSVSISLYSASYLS